MTPENIIVTLSVELPEADKKLIVDGIQRAIQEVLTSRTEQCAKMLDREIPYCDLKTKHGQGYAECAEYMASKIRALNALNQPEQKENAKA